VIGTRVAPGWGTAIGGGIGAIEGLFEGWWQRDKEGKQRRWQESELMRQYSALENIANIQTAGQQDAINKQLEINNRNLASTFAVSGGIRTGNYQRKVGELNEQAVTDVANVTRQNALQAKMIEMGYTNQVQNFNLELAKLESAKASGDTQMAGVAAENLAPILYDMFFKPKGEIPVTNPEEITGGVMNSNYRPDEEILGGGYPTSDYGKSPTFDFIRNLYKPKPKSSAGMFAPQQDNTDPISILWGT
jgi:hypothetical protein